MNRSQAREYAFKLLYQIEIQKEISNEDMALFFENNDIKSSEAKEYIEDVVNGIKVDINEKEAKIDVNIIVEYGIRIPDVAFEIQNRVKKAVETMTGLKVLSVNVRVQGVSMPEEKNEEEKNIENMD